MHGRKKLFDPQLKKVAFIEQVLDRFSIVGHWSPIKAESLTDIVLDLGAKDLEAIAYSAKYALVHVRYGALGDLARVLVQPSGANRVVLRRLYAY